MGAGTLTDTQVDGLTRRGLRLEQDLFIGVPAVLGAGGVEKIVEMKLGEKEKGMLEISANAVREVVALLPYNK